MIKNLTLGMTVGAVASAAVAIAAAMMTPREVLDAHGADEIGQIAELHFDFVVVRNDNEMRRSWQWHPITGDVRFQQGEDVYEYNRNTMTEADEPVDGMWINDTFWAYWPMHAQWTADATVTVEEPMPNPVTDAEEPRLVIAYPADGGGYTPGDRYEIYLDENGLGTAWTFHRGGGEAPNLANSFENYVMAGPLAIPTLFQSRDGGFRLEIQNVKYRLEGESAAREATPLEP